MPKEGKPFIFGLAGEDYEARMYDTVVCLFRKQPEIDYFKHITEENSVYVFNNQELARHIGGFVLQGKLLYPDKGFRKAHRWNAPVIIEDVARQYEVDLYIQANSQEERPEWLP